MQWLKCHRHTNFTLTTATYNDIVQYIFLCEDTRWLF